VLRALHRYARLALPRGPDAAERAREGAAFERWARPWLVLYTAVTALVYGGVLLVLTWPLDHALLGDDAERASFAALRATNTAVALVSLLGLLLSPVRRHVTAWCGLTLVAYSIGGSFHASALPHDPFFWPAVFSPLGTSAMLVAFAPRVAWTLAIGAAHVATWYLRRPEAWAAPETPASLGLYAHALVFSIGLGHVVHLFAWQIFRDRQKQRAMARELEGWNERLRREVDARTADLRRLARRLEDVHEDERRRLAHELHDELGQSLTALRLEVAVLGRHGLSREQRRALDARLDELLESVQWTVSSLRPKALEEQGLVPACEWLLARFAAQTGLDVDSAIDEAAAPSAETSLAVFRVLQEALTNVGKHAEASGVSVSLAREGDDIVLSVTDDGAGFDLPSEPRAEGGHGLLGMRERALAIGGTVEIEGHHVGADGQPAGARVVLRVPVRAEREGRAEAR
jgi:signal transduction histidine kinase